MWVESKTRQLAKDLVAFSCSTGSVGLCQVCLRLLGMRNVFPFSEVSS
jgi:hypothetical protein